MIDAAQRAAGVLLARHRGEREDAAALMATFADEGELASGALLLADLALGLYAQAAERDIDGCVQELSLQLEQAVVSRTP